MIVYRLSQGKYKTDLTGSGAELAGGRWNSKSTAVLYTSQNIALCTAEVAVHIPLGIVPQDYFLISIEIPDKVTIEKLKFADLDPDWKKFPPSNSTKIFGENFILRHKSLVLQVPSAVVQGEYNYLINPRHPEFTSITILSIEPFKFERRLFVR